MQSSTGSLVLSQDATPPFPSATHSPSSRRPPHHFSPFIRPPGHKILPATLQCGLRADPRSLEPSQRPSGKVSVFSTDFPLSPPSVSHLFRPLLTKRYSTTFTRSLTVRETLRCRFFRKGAHWSCRRGDSFSALFRSSSLSPTSTFPFSETTSQATNETTPIERRDIRDMTSPAHDDCPASFPSLSFFPPTSTSS
jgi:hypothetical protein